MKGFVYFNLNRKCWSIKAMEGPSKGLVVGHAKYVDMADVTWKVSEAGRQRVIRDKRKNVHAGAVGNIQRWLGVDGRARSHCEGKSTFDRHSQSPSVPDCVTYNPYRAPTFTDVDTGDPVTHSECAFMCPDKRVYVYGRNK